MSIIDAKLEMCDNIALGTTAGANALIGDVIDLGARRNFYDAAVTGDIGEAGDMWLNVKVSTLLASSGSATCTVALYHHTTAAVASGAIVSGMTATTGASSAAGTTLIRAKLPAGTINRYIGICSDIDTAALTAGSVDAWISMDGETPK